jgi:hypothetical protein
LFYNYSQYAEWIELFSFSNHSKCDQYLAHLMSLFNKIERKLVASNFNRFPRKNRVTLHFFSRSQSLSMNTDDIQNYRDSPWIRAKRVGYYSPTWTDRADCPSVSSYAASVRVLLRALHKSHKDITSARVKKMKIGATLGATKRWRLIVGIPRCAKKS